MPDPQDQGQDQAIPANSGINIGAPEGTARSFITSLVNIGAARKNSATNDLNRMLTAAKAGFPVDPKAIQKSAKKAGIPLMSEEDMKGLLTPAGEQSPENGAQPKGAQGTQPNPYDVKKITDVKERQKAETNFAVDGLVRQAVMNHQLRGATEQQVLEHTNKLMELKNQALSGDARALGTLAQNAEVKIDVPTNVWMAYSPTQKNKYLEMTYGAETDAQKTQRTQNIATHLFDTGEVTSPEAAQKIATILADGGSLPPDLKSQLRPESLNDLLGEVDVAGKLADIGFSGDQIAGFARNANMTGLGNFFPSGMKTIQQQTLETRNKEIQVQRAQVGVEGERATTERMSVKGYDVKNPDGTTTHIAGQLESQQTDAEARKLSAENTANRIKATMSNQDYKDFVANYTALVDVKRAGGTVDPDVLNLMEKKIVEKSGGQVTMEDAKGFWNYVTFGLIPTHNTRMKMGVDPDQAGKVFNDSTPDTNDNSGGDPATQGAGSPQP